MESIARFAHRFRWMMLRCRAEYTAQPGADNGRGPFTGRARDVVRRARWHHPIGLGLRQQLGRDGGVCLAPAL